MNDQTQPQNQDAILGGQAPPTGTVLGGLDRIKQRLLSSIGDQQITDSTRAAQFREEETHLLVQVLKQKKSRQLRWAAYSVLSQRTERAIADAVFQYNPYRSFQPLFSIEHRGDWKYPPIFGFTPDSKHLVMLSRHGSKERLEVWSLATETLIHSIELNLEERRPHSRFAISADGQNFFVELGSHQMHVGNLWTGQTVETLQSQPRSVAAIAISRDGQYMAVGNTSDIKVWNLKTKQSYYLKHLPHPYGSEIYLEFSPDGQKLISRTDVLMKVWRSHTGELLHTLMYETEGYDVIKDVYFNSDGKTIVSLSSKSVIRAWSLETGEMVGYSELIVNHGSLFNRVYSLETRGSSKIDNLHLIVNWGTAFNKFSPDGQTLLCAGNYMSGSFECLYTIDFWNWKTGKLIHSIQNEAAGLDRAVIYALFSLNGQFALMVSSSKKYDIWGLPVISEEL